MEPSSNICPSSLHLASTLRFKPLRVSDIDRIGRILEQAPTRSCDFTVGGLFLWTSYFHYRYAIADDTLFISCLSATDPTRHAFLMPVGQIPVHQAVERVHDYCASMQMECRFTEVPGECIDSLAAIPGATVSELPDFADYLYLIEPLASLSGKKMAKKRNHVNRFTALNPGYTLEPITAANVEEVERFYQEIARCSTHCGDSARFEAEMVATLLPNLADYPFEGALLSTPEHGIVGFTIAEVKGDTLHIHIEKMDHRVDGAGEMLNHLFAAEMLRRHPGILYVNRQDDAGDPGLRAAKLSYHPTALLRKYDLILPC